VEGKVAALGVFPYSDAFLRRALALPFVDGVVSYFNTSETELSPYLDSLHAGGRGVIGIRPLRAGAVKGERAVAEAIAFALAHPAIASTIVGLSSAAQIDAAVAAAR
jgi:aryl-alcohol dehydrogenase-like predicted oxidoreductase